MTDPITPADLIATGPTFTPPKKKRKWPWIVGAALAAVILIPAIAAAGNKGDTEVPTTSQTGGGFVRTEDTKQTPVPVDTRVVMPELVGLTVAEAIAALHTAGLTMDPPAEMGTDWIITSQSVPGGTKVEPTDSTLGVTADAPKPVYTLAQQNAIGKAESYLSHMPFSRTGLIGQLEYEGYSNADAVFGVDHVTVDWNEQAGLKAKSYLSHMTFSRQGLYDQLAYEGYTPEQIEAGLAFVGY
jgi:hypothetical protein